MQTVIFCGMPIYEYRCEKCGAEFEELQKVGADAPPCSSCSSASVQRKVSRTSFVLKGGGWYKDGYSTTGSGSTAKDSGKSSSADTSTPSTTTTSKPSSTDD